MGEEEYSKTDRIKWQKGNIRVINISGYLGKRKTALSCKGERWNSTYSKGKSGWGTEKKKC